MKNLFDFIKDDCGGVAVVAREANVTSRAVYLWCEKNSLPRTDYTGETSHAETLARLSGEPADVIKCVFNPAHVRVAVSL